jgi:hypothetical protein
VIYRKKIGILLLLCALSLIFWSCDHGQLGGADKTSTYFPGDGRFEERMSFLSGLWYSHYAGIGWLDSYRIRRWDNFTGEDKAKAQALFTAININNPRAYSTKDSPRDGDYVVLYDDTVYGQQDGASSSGGANRGFVYMGLVRAVNIFNDDINRGAVIIEYFEGADPKWLSDRNGYAYQGLEPGEKPFFGIYYRVLGPDVVQMANAIDLAALSLGYNYHTEKGTLAEAVEANGVENEAEFISWGVVIPQNREKE